MQKLQDIWYIYENIWILVKKRKPSNNYAFEELYKTLLLWDILDWYSTKMFNETDWTEKFYLFCNNLIWKWNKLNWPIDEQNINCIDYLVSEIKKIDVA